MKYISILLALWLWVSCTSKNNLAQVYSPNQKLQVSVRTNAHGNILYSVLYRGDTLITPSPLGFTEKDSLNLSSEFEIKNVTFTQKNETWTQPWGENKILTDHHNQMSVELENPDVQLFLDFRLFDEGLGFRYRYQVHQKDTLFLTNELTEFNFAQEGTAWCIPASFETYELPYKEQKISEVKSANTPITFRWENALYASLHEAALTDFPEMTLRRTKNPLGFKADLAPWAEKFRAVVPSHFQTPWRTLQIGEKAVDLINSSLILNLNEPSRIKDPSWIRPVKYVGVWWGMHLGIQGWYMGDRHGATTQNALKHIQFAKDNNIQAVLFEGWNKGWENWGTSQAFNFTEPYEDFDIRKIADFAREQGVKIIGHHETGGNIDNYESQLDKAFSWYKSLGIDMVKTGYAGGITGGEMHHGQFMVRHYRKVVETAAKYQIMLNVHEPIKPTGIRRTYPNMMTREGVRGMEWNAWSEGNSPTHTVTIPFTRMLAGPIDYTPGIFDILYETANKSPLRKKWNGLDPGNTREHTTLCKQIANWVVIYSPMQMASDLIEHYDHPAFAFFRDFDADCDTSQALQGEVGQFVAIVRQAKGKFFLGATTNETPRELSVPLSFLPQGKNFEATIYADGQDAHYQSNPLSYQILTKKVSSQDTLQIRLAAGGGQAIVFKEISKQ